MTRVTGQSNGTGQSNVANVTAEKYVTMIAMVSKVVLRPVERCLCRKSIVKTGL